MSLTREELATAAGTTVDEVESLVDVGLLARADAFAPTDIGRIRLILAIEAAGVARDRLARIVASRSASLDFVDLLMPDPVPLSRETQGELAERTAVPEHVVRSLRAVLGTIASSDSEQVRTDDAHVIEIAERALEMGADDEQLTRIVLVTADAARMLVAAQRDFIDEVVIAPAVAASGSELAAVLETAATRVEYRHLGVELFEYLYRRTVEVAVFQSLVEMAQLGLERLGASPPVPPSPPAIVFADVSEFTHVTEERGDAAAAELASRFAGVVQETAALDGGTQIKRLGDGALVMFPDPTSAVRSMLELSRRAEAVGLPSVHIGIDAGTIVRRDGDVFGTVVNLASRAGAHAGPGEVLVTDAVKAAWDGSGVAFREVGEVELRGLGRPVALFLAETDPTIEDVRR